ncbi:MAG: hypothetical protein ABSH47_27390 [Bryobacteraceae bacterium]|jgi:hypothetical protein
MDVAKIIIELRQERDQIDAAILSLQRLAASSGERRRGRPPAWMAALKPDVPKRRGRPPGSKNKPKKESS